MKYYIINTIPVNYTFEDKRFMSYKKGSDFLKRDNVIKNPCVTSLTWKTVLESVSNFLNMKFFLNISKLPNFSYIIRLDYT